MPDEKTRIENAMTQLRDAKTIQELSDACRNLWLRQVVEDELERNLDRKPTQYETEATTGAMEYILNKARQRIKDEVPDIIEDNGFDKQIDILKEIKKAYPNLRDIDILYNVIITVVYTGKGVTYQHANNRDVPMTLEDMATAIQENFNKKQEQFGKIDIKTVAITPKTIERPDTNLYVDIEGGQYHFVIPKRVIGMNDDKIRRFFAGIVHLSQSENNPVLLWTAIRDMNPDDLGKFGVLYIDKLPTEHI